VTKSESLKEMNRKMVMVSITPLAKAAVLQGVILDRPESEVVCGTLR
jgi:hypothetical protein